MSSMRFTYDGYRQLILLLKRHGYAVADYHDWKTYQRCVILRHDIDNDIACALNFARLEADLRVRSTYFVLPRSDMYNPFSYRNLKMLREILCQGHAIGLHFDEMNYPETMGDPNLIQGHILEETAWLERALGCPVSCVSMHRPSRKILAADIVIPGMVNSYGQTFFHSFKYLSDSRRRWREAVEEVVESEEYERLHILTHAFWYREKEQDMRMILDSFINHANDERYRVLWDNIANLDEIISESDVKGYVEGSD